MSFFTSIRTAFLKYAEFNGHATRSEFWWWILFNFLVLSVFTLFDIIRIGDGTLGTLLGGIWSLATLLPNLSITVRRLRDADYSWIYIFWSLIPVAGIFILAYFVAQPSKNKTVL